VNLAVSCASSYCSARYWPTLFLALLLSPIAGTSATELPTSAGTSAPQHEAASTKLLQALPSGDLSALKDAIREGAEVNGANTNMPPLLALLQTSRAGLTAAQRECLAYLLDNGASVDPRDNDGRTPLIIATQLGDIETIRLLVLANANVRARDNFHKKALFYAVEMNRRDIVLYLVSHGELISLSPRERKQMAAR
jgi:ankyrin repeat protein